MVAVHDHDLAAAPRQGPLLDAVAQPLQTGDHVLRHRLLCQQRIALEEHARSIERLRVEAARRLLTDSRLPIKRISQRCGFGSEETMRRSFLRVLSVTPQDYRLRFSS